MIIFIYFNKIFMPIIKSCLQCKTNFKTIQSTINRGGGKFCCHKCSMDYPRAPREKTDGYTPTERFFLFIDKISNPNGCWEWIGHKNKGGYGRIRRFNSDWTTHRYSWFIHFGTIPQGIFICHHCDNRICCNPSHLFLGTAKDNQRDCISKKRNRDQKGSKHNFAKLTESEVIQIRKRLSHGELGKNLAMEFNVCKMTISNIKNRKKWT